MRDGFDVSVHIPAPVIAVGVLMVVVGLAYMIKGQLPEAARYLKIERM